MSELHIDGLGYQYSTRDGATLQALDDVNLQFRDGQFVAVVGPSGCGKSTLLHLIDGLLRPTAGQILIDGAPIHGPGDDRAMVFQAASLLPWMTVLQNIAFGLTLQGRDKDSRMQIARELVSLVGLSGFEGFHPFSLSGGMQQRVNLARALAVDPKILLMDEPFAALDAQTREFMQQELLRVWSATKKTAVFITHQTSEAVFLADTVVILTGRPGRVQKVLEIDLPRPRDLSIKRDPRFLEYDEALWNLMETEARQRASN